MTGRPRDLHVLTHSFPKRRSSDLGTDWARRFDDHARQVMIEGPDDAVSLVAHRDYAMSAPTPEHFLPLLHLAAFAAATGETPAVPVHVYAFRSLSTACSTLGCAATAAGSRLHATAPPIAHT